MSLRQYFQTIAEIDFLYHSLEEHTKNLAKPVSPINAAIDKATGYNKVKSKKNWDTAIDILRQIIERKKKIDISTEGDEKTLADLLTAQKALDI